MAKLGKRNEDISDFKPGCSVLIRTKGGEFDVFVVDRILNDGRAGREVVLFVARQAGNKCDVYFIWSMYQRGESWIADAWVLEV
jgi:hypothetical protein